MTVSRISPSAPALPESNCLAVTMSRLEKLKGFVLGSFPLSDHRHMVTLFTESSGKRKGVFRVTKQQPQAYLAPLTCLLFQLKGKEQQELKTMSQVSLEYHRYQLASRYLGLSLLQHWATLVTLSQPEEHEEPRVFRLLHHCLADLQEGAQDPALILANLYFEAWLLHFCGILPRPGRTRAASITHPEIPVSGEDRLRRDLDARWLHLVFEQRIEHYLRDALELGSLTRTSKVLGKMWEQFLAKELPTRKLLRATPGQRRKA